MSAYAVFVFYDIFDVKSKDKHLILYCPCVTGYFIDDTEGGWMDIQYDTFVIGK